MNFWCCPDNTKMKPMGFHIGILFLFVILSYLEAFFLLQIFFFQVSMLCGYMCAALIKSQFKLC
jgi:hypothetical protein